MAIGFIPKHTEEISLGGLTQKEALIIVIKAAQKINWEVNYISNSGILAYTNNGFFVWNAEVTVKLENATANIKSSSSGNDMIDWGKNKNNVTAFILAFDELKARYTKDELHMEYLLIEDSLPAEQEDQLLLPPTTRAEQIKDFVSIFKPVKNFLVTPILIDINILIFILMVISGVSIFAPDNDGLLNWGANFKPLTLGGEWWRLITSCFIHIGIIHLLLNMYALLYIGALLEPILGSAKFFSAYMLAGLTGSMASLWWHDLSIGAGASGAIFGMYGVFLAMLTTKLIEKNSRKALLTSIAVFVGYNLLFGLQGGIDNAAHIGGLFGGMIIGYSYIPSLQRPDNLKFTALTIGLLSVIILTGSFIVYNKLPNDIGVYEKKINRFVSLEDKALTIYNLPKDMPNDSILYIISNKGIPSWNDAIQLLDSLNELNLPSNIVTRNLMLREYCQLRLSCYNYIYKAINQNTNKYQAQIDSCNAAIDDKIKQIKAND